MMRFTQFFLIIILFLAVIPFNVSYAQANQPEGLIYIVEPGDTLWAISRFVNVTLDDLVSVNEINDPSQVLVGTRLIIPGYDGIQGVLAIDKVPFGESIESLSRQYQIPVIELIRLNRWTTPDSAAAGSTLRALEKRDEIGSSTGERSTLRNGMSVLELALYLDMNPWALAQSNYLLGVRSVLPGKTLLTPGSSDPGPGALPEAIQAIEFIQPAVVQGKTFELKLWSSKLDSVEGNLGDWKLNFFPYDDGYVTLQGIHAMQEPGYYPATMTGLLADGTRFVFSQHIYIEDGGYPFDPPLVVNSETIDIENTQPEDLEWYSVVEPVTKDRMWAGMFVAPVPDPLKDCFPSLFGNRRSYNGSGYAYFHTGLDFCGRTGVEIFAPAAGRVVFADSLVVRGNATVIDHGWGVYTAFAHQSEIYVSVGDMVEKGEIIGLIGSTGRVTGPHLHWEVIVGGVQVDPMDWLEKEFP